VRAARGDHRHTVLSSLSSSDANLTSREVDVLNTQPETLRQSETGAIEHQRDEVDIALELSEKGANFLAIEDDGQARRRSRANGRSDIAEWTLEHIVVEQHQCAQRLDLGRSRDLLLRCEIREEVDDLGVARGVGMPEAGHHPCIARTTADSSRFEHRNGSRTITSEGIEIRRAPAYPGPRSRPHTSNGAFHARIPDSHS
jgi:hypothetical protein